jgi:hypothetical protein
VSLLVVLVVTLAVLGFGGNIWLLAQEADHGHGGRRTNTRVLRALAAASCVVVAATLAFARPWGSDLALAAVAGSLLLAVLWSLRSLWRGPRRSRRRRYGLAAIAVCAGVALLAMSGTSAVLDSAIVWGSPPRPVFHGGGVLSRPVLYQLFWGPAWDDGPRPALAAAVAFQDGLANSPWVAAVEAAGFGVTSITSGGCWIDPSPPAQPVRPATSLAAGPVPDEIRATLSGRHALTGCPGTNPEPVPRTLPADAVVMVWLPPDVPYRLGGVAAHGAVAWPGRPQGLAAAGLPGSYASWGLPACTGRARCGSPPPAAPPTYALSHELVEAVTNPYGRGWFADTPLAWTARYVLGHGPSALVGVRLVYPGEVADLCEPGRPAARAGTGRADAGLPGVPVSPFYRPGTGCVG